MGKKTDSQKLVVTYVLDETGSMMSLKDATISGFNEYVENLKRQQDEVIFSLLKFDSSHQTLVHDNVPVKEVKKLNAETYTPGAATPLYDAVAAAISSTERSLSQHTVDHKHCSECHAQLPETGKPLVLVVIHTDGEENSSREHTLDGVKALIEQKRAEGWEFVFMGAGVDRWVGTSMGISAGSTFTYDHVPEAHSMAFSAASLGTVAYSSSRGATAGNFFDTVVPQDEKTGK